MSYKCFIGLSASLLTQYYLAFYHESDTVQHDHQKRLLKTTEARDTEGARSFLLFLAAGVAGLAALMAIPLQLHQPPVPAGGRAGQD
jgi:hypothetical protein